MATLKTFTKDPNAVLDYQLNWAAWLDTGHTLATDQFLSAIASGDRVATSGNLASKTSTAGVFNAANVTFTAVSGAACGALVLYKDTGAAGTSPLIAYIDTATGLPVTPNGGDI